MKTYDVIFDSIKQNKDPIFNKKDAIYLLRICQKKSGRRINSKTDRIEFNKDIVTIKDYNDNTSRAKEDISKKLIIFKHEIWNEAIEIVANNIEIVGELAVDFEKINTDNLLKNTIVKGTDRATKFIKDTSWYKLLSDTDKNLAIEKFVNFIKDSKTLNEIIKEQHQKKNSSKTYFYLKKVIREPDEIFSNEKDNTKPKSDDVFIKLANSVFDIYFGEISSTNDLIKTVKKEINVQLIDKVSDEDLKEILIDVDNNIDKIKGVYYDKIKEINEVNPMQNRIDRISKDKEELSTKGIIINKLIWNDAVKIVADTIRDSSNLVEDFEEDDDVLLAIAIENGIEKAIEYIKGSDWYHTLNDNDKYKTIDKFKTTISDYEKEVSLSNEFNKINDKENIKKDNLNEKESTQIPYTYNIIINNFKNSKDWQKELKNFNNTELKITAILSLIKSPNYTCRKSQLFERSANSFFEVL